MASCPAPVNLLKPPNTRATASLYTQELKVARHFTFRLTTVAPDRTLQIQSNTPGTRIDMRTCCSSVTVHGITCNVHMYMCVICSFIYVYIFCRWCIYKYICVNNLSRYMIHISIVYTYVCFHDGIWGNPSTKSSEAGDYYLTSVTGILWYMMDGYTHTMGASNTNRTPSMTP